MNRIAIADDHKLFRRGIIELINDLSEYQIVNESSNGLELIHYVRESKLPDLIILDIQMPVMNGFETLEQLKKDFPEVKILALSMYEDEQSIIRMLRAGANGYVLKDAEPEELEDAISCIIEKGFYYSNDVGQMVLNQLQSNMPKDLKERELEFLQLVCTELTYKEIATKMCVSPRTVDGYRESLFFKLDIKSRVGLVLYAIKHGIFKV